MGLFDFVQQHHAVRLAADPFAELTALFVSHVSGRRADEPGDAVLLHIFTHVDAHDIILRVEEILRQGACQAGLTHAGRAKEEECADGPVRVLEAGAAPLDCTAYGFHGLVLADDAAFQAALHLHQAVAFRLRDLVHGNARHLGNHRGDIFIRNDGRTALDTSHLKPYHGTGLVYCVDGLVRQGTVRHIAVGEAYGGLDCLRSICHVMEFLVMRLQALEDFDGLAHGCGFNHNPLEAAVKRAVLFHDLGELVHRGCADALDFSACKGGLEHIGGIQAAGGTAGANDGVDFVDEQDNIRILPGLIQNGLDALFEIAPVLGAGHH